MASKDKYDRQLRLWGVNGQRKLSNAHVLLAGANAVGSETLKNLILPGVGRFTVLDSARVADSDLSSNFFVEASKIGESRAQTVCELLADLNPDSSGNACNRDIDELISNEREYFRQFTLIVAANIPDSTLIPLSRICEEFSVHLVIVDSTGYFGSLRLQYKNVEIIEGRNSNERVELSLHLNNPFPTLRSYLERTANLIESRQVNKETVGELSKITIFYLAMKKWREKSGNQATIPQGKDRDEFRKSIRMIFNDLPNPPSMTGQDEKSTSIPDCFDTSDAFWICNHYTHQFNDLQYNSVEVFGSESGERPSQVTKFSILTEAFRLFIARFDRLPVNGQIPDLGCASAVYREILDIYMTQAADDKEMFKHLFSEIYAKWGVSPTEFEIGQDLLDAFFKNILHLRRLTSTPYYKEAEAASIHDVNNVFMESVWEFDVHVEGFKPTMNAMSWYAASRAARKFRSSEGRNATEADTDAVWALVLKDLNVNPDDPSSNENHDQIMESINLQTVEEVCRFEGKETIHNVSSLIGGVAAGESVKLIAEMFLPLDNLFLYNGLIGNAKNFQMKVA